MPAHHAGSGMWRSEKASLHTKMAAWQKYIRRVGRSCGSQSADRHCPVHPRKPPRLQVLGNEMLPKTFDRQLRRPDIRPMRLFVPGTAGACSQRAWLVTVMAADARGGSHWQKARRTSTT